MISHIDIGYNGRLGNQLFIYALLYKLKLQGKEVFIPFTNYNWKQDGCLDQYHMKWIPYHTEVFDLDNTSLKGYFQSWKYFDDIKEDLKKELSFKSQIKEKIDLIYNSHSQKTTVCIHIRLGDTLSQPWMHKLSPEYIQDCFSHLPPDEYNFIIVSDNFEYCKNWFPQSEDIYFAEGLNEAETIFKNCISK